MAKILTIERAKWRRGGYAAGENETLLFNAKDGLMCCLGFDALACGVPIEQIENAGDPADILDLDDFPDYAAGRILEDPAESALTPAVLAAIQHNDNETIADDEREKLIREDLIALGWDDVVFV